MGLSNFPDIAVGDVFTIDAPSSQYFLNGDKATIVKDGILFFEPKHFKEWGKDCEVELTTEEKAFLWSLVKR